MDSAPIQSTRGLMPRQQNRLHLPIIFIGHSLGGVIIKHALCGQDAEETVDDTSGIIFLGTPHLGSSASVAGAILAFATRLLGSDTTLLLSLKSHDAQLSNLAARFRSVVVQNERRGQETRIISFYETKPTYLLGWLSLGRVVARDSAVVHADEEHDIDSDHSGLNKCAGRGDELYQKLKKAVDDLRVPSLLEQADKLICDKHYTESKLRIERLSGDQLPMDQCYINLAMVEKFGPDADRSDQRDANLSPFTLLSRQKAETPSNADSSKTLFLLDGLDELSQDLTGHGSIPNFLAELLQQRNVIITSRPNANHPALQDLDLELETIAFSPKQVNAYLDADPNMMPRANEVKSFLQHHRLIQGLVRIPIQLDALCYAWEDLKRTTLPNTMTRIYQAIEQKLWKKDAVRLNKISEGDAQIARPAEIKLRVKTEIALLECFAFNGLHSDVIDFTPDHRDKLVEMSQLSDLPLDETLARLSFLRTSDPSTRLEDRNYHFLHLTFQEFFAARYFVKQWKDGKPLAHYSEATVAALAPLLKDEDDNVRLRAAEVLEKQSKLPETALSALGALLEDEEWTVRIRAAEILEKQSNLPEATLSARGALLKDEDEDICLRAPALLEKQSNLPEATLAAPEALAALEALTPPRMNMKVIARSHATETFLWRLWLLLAVLFAVEMLKSMEYTVPHLVPEVEALLALSALVALVALAELEALAKLEALTAPRKNMDVIAAETLLRQSKLPLAALLALVAMLKSRMYTFLYSGVPDFVPEILESQSKLPEAALSALVALLKDEEEIVRFRGAKVLKKRSKLPEATLAMLETLLKDEDKDVRLRAIEILETQSRLSEATLSALGALLKDEDEDVRLRAVEVLQRQTKLPEATLATLETLLKDEDKGARLLATEILEKQSNLPEAMRSALRALLKDEDEDVRLRAAEVLKMQSKLPEATVSALGSLLKDEVEDVRLRAAEILEKQTKLPETALSALGALLEDEEWTVRIRAAEGSGKQSKLPDAATGTLATLLALLTLLNDEEWTVRLRAIGALGAPSKLLEASALGALLKGEDEEIRFCAAMDLPEATLSALVALVTDEEWNIYLRAAEIFEMRSKLPGATLSALGAALLKDEERVVRLSAVGALGRQSRLPEATVSALVTLLKDEGERVRSRAAMALGKQSKLPEATVSALVALLKDEEWTVRSLADRALAGQSDLPEKFLKSIGSLLESENQGEITASAICIPEYARLLYQISTSQMDCEQFLSSITGPIESWTQSESTATGGMLTATRSGIVAMERLFAKR
ncbi:armadillo-type fold domain-containing protein [Purpureocillium lilacinum]|uniref:Protein SERAC1 n=1 Tax=Purpureocillium lilacinum TaxID=33203 RepID=A0A179HHV9_PURLI|nr:armadillo-type fold domain-containing protein [Purpureocillium lilacinum]OAQ89063.1 armadillo-type fold domain-containing protein [Purpureocillium lilacinum]